MKNLNKLALFVALGAGIAIAQSTPQGSQSTPSSPSTSPSTQDQSAQPAQPAQPSTDQSKQPANAPEQMPKTDQSSTSQSSTTDQSATSQSSTSDKDKSSDQSSKLPQSDASAASSGDVASQVQSALQQDPKLSGANITAKVNGKDLELNGTVQSADEKKQAEKVAKSNAGSLKVKNHIKVASSTTGATDKSGSNPPKY